MALSDLRKELRRYANVKKAKILQRFFKTGPGEYGEGDIFLGIVVPDSRRIAVKYENLDFGGIKKLLGSKIHEERLIALLILTNQLKFATTRDSKPYQRRIFDFYLKNTKYINNWDLVDLSSHQIIGEYLYKIHVDNSETINSLAGVLGKLVKSKDVWERRIAIISTFAFIKKGEPGLTLKIAKMLLGDEHDLIHKAVGWMLREVGKKSQVTLEKFLKANYKKMPRTTLRYATERFSKKKRRFYLIDRI